MKYLDTYLTTNSCSIDGDAITLLVAMTILSFLLGMLLVNEEDSNTEQNNDSGEDTKSQSRRHKHGFRIIEYWCK